MVEKKNVVNMGMKSNMKTCNKDHEDDVQRQQNVETSRQLIYEFGVPLKADRLKTVLGEHLLVPTRVSVRTALMSMGVL